MTHQEKPEHDPDNSGYGDSTTGIALEAIDTVVDWTKAILKFLAIAGITALVLIIVVLAAIIGDPR